MREKHFGKREAKPLLSIGEARERATKIDWQAVDISQPGFTGIRIETDFPLEPTDTRAIDSQAKSRIRAGQGYPRTAMPRLARALG